MISRTRQPALEAVRPGELLGPLRLYSRRISVDHENGYARRQCQSVGLPTAYLYYGWMDGWIASTGQVAPGMPRFCSWETAYLLPIPTGTGAASTYAAGLGFGLLAK